MQRLRRAGWGVWGGSQTCRAQLQEGQCLRPQAPFNELRLRLVLGNRPLSQSKPFGL